MLISVFLLREDELLGNSLKSLANMYLFEYSENIPERLQSTNRNSDASSQQVAGPVITRTILFRNSLPSFGGRSTCFAWSGGRT